MGRKKNIVVKHRLPGWVMTYGDMMSLLLTFFVLIVSFSSMQESKFQQAANSLKDAFGVLSAPESVIAFNDPLVPAHHPTEEEADVLYEVRAVEKIILDEGLDKQVAVEVRDEGVLFRLNAPFLFNPVGQSWPRSPRASWQRCRAFLPNFPIRSKSRGIRMISPSVRQNFRPTGSFPRPGQSPWHDTSKA